LLYTRLRAGNYGGSGFAGSPYRLSTLDRAFGTAQVTSGGSVTTTGTNDVFLLDRLYYRFPAGKELTVVVGPRMRNTETLAITPFYYSDLDVLDAFKVFGAPGAYNKATGGGAAVIWKQNVKKGKPFFAASLSYVAPNANAASTTGNGGIFENSSNGNLLTQVGYQANQWKTTFAWRYGQCGQLVNRQGTAAAVQSETCPTNFNTATVDSNNFALGLAWTPKKNGTIVPSISAGWGYSAYTQNGVTVPALAFSATQGSTGQLLGANIAATQSWTVALQWKDAFIKGNSAGMAVGQPSFVTALRNGATAQDGNYAWEWWYKFQVTDNISVAPALFYLSNPSSAGAATTTTVGTGASVFGGLVVAQFKF
jgi:hypothetical protein